jgi:hypothetical protein
MTIIKDRIPVYLKLAIEEVDCAGHSGAGRDCEYSIYDPSGVVEGELFIRAKDLDLLKKLHHLRIHPDAESVVSPVAAAGKVVSYLSPGSRLPDTVPRHPGAPLSAASKARDLPPGITAGGLLMEVAEATGTVDPFSVSLFSLLDDLLVPQKPQ